MWLRVALYIRWQQVNKTMDKKIKCYISSDSSYDLSKVENILYKLGVETHNFYDFSIGSSFSDLIKRKIRESDFVVALITQKNQNVLFELGVAEAIGKPIFLLVEQNVKLPFFLEGKMYYQLDWSKNTQLLELTLKNYILDISNKYTRYKKRKIESERTNLSIDDTNESLIRLNQFRTGDFREYELINLIMNVFKKLNIQAVSEMALGDRSRVDIAITNDSLSSFFGNPILFEVKAGRINRNRIEDAQYQLQNYLDKTEAKFGILLYFDRDNKRFGQEFCRVPNILMFDIEDFIQGVSSEGFEPFMIRARNEYVHGLSNLS